MDVDIDIGAQVRDVNGRAVGEVSGVIVDPQRDVVTDLVVHRGLLVTADRVVPIEAVSRIEDHRIQLSMSAEEVDRQPDLNERAQIPLAWDGEHTPREWTPPPSRAIWPLFNPIEIRPTVIEEVWRDAPEGSQVLRDGLPVYAADGELVGQVDELIEDPETHTLDAIMVKSVSAERGKAIPVEWIERSDENAGITLAVGADAVAQLPDYH